MVTATGVPSVVVAPATGAVPFVVSEGEVDTVDAPGPVDVAGATLAFESAPPPPQAARVVPNTAIAAIRIAKFWSGSVMAVFKEVTVGNKVLPQGISEDYAKAKLLNRCRKGPTQYFFQIQHNIVGCFTKIIRYISFLSFFYVPVSTGCRTKKTAR
ncbi:hypothetical protein [Massilia niabensis]|uniref:Uncharacterized protein n=1 Tax=Massilia niabensis TaxID=544910 RepID=A0ABW0L2Z8_9BURK